MKIYYALFYPLLHFIAAIGLAILSIFAYVQMDRIPPLYETVFIVVLIIRGFLFIRIPYFEIKEFQLNIFNRLGRIQKTYVFDQLEDFILENNQIYIQVKGKYKKVRITRMFVSSEKWTDLLSLLKQSDLKKELH